VFLQRSPKSPKRVIAVDWTRCRGERQVGRKEAGQVGVGSSVVDPDVVAIAETHGGGATFRF